MAMAITNLSIYIGKREILKDQSVGLGDGSKIGLIGRNGVGKTTLLKAILGKMDYAGNIEFNGRVAYFSQSIDIDLTKTGRETLEVKATIHHQNEFEKELAEVEKLLQTEEIYNDHDKLTKLTEKYVDLQTKLAASSESHPNSKIKSVIKKLNFASPIL